MKRAIIILLIALIVYLFAGIAGAQRAVEWTGSAILIKAAYNQITEVKFPEEIATVLSDTNQLSVIVKGQYLYIKPMVTAADENMYALAESGASYPLLVKVGDERDDSVQIFAPQERLREAIKEVSETTPLNLIKAMMRDEALLEFEVTTPESEKLVYGRDGFLEIRLIKAYTAPVMWGYVLKVENKAPFPVRISPQEIDMPGLLAISIDEEYLAPRATKSSELVAGHYQATMYLVIEANSNKGEIFGLPGLAE